MKILHVIHDHPQHPLIGGGGAVRVHELAKRLASRGHEICIVSGWFDGCETCVSKEQRYRTLFLGPHRQPACKAVEFALAAWRALPTLTRDIDVIIEDFSPYAPVGAYRLERHGKAVFLQIQNYTGGEFRTRHGWLAGTPVQILERCYPRRFRNHILVGEHLRSRFQSREHSQVIPMGFSPEPISVENPVHSRDYIAFLGRMDFHQKGLDILLEALAGTTLPVRFAGSGRESARLEAALSRLPECRFVGRLEGRAKWNFLAGARFLAMPSRFEGQPIVAIEASAAGTPILASPIPELDFVTEASIGRQCDMLDAACLRTALTAMWESADGLARYTHAARDFSRTRTWDHIADQFEGALLEAVARKK
jgi:glycosyltransferase involved in cell wall biosynthesis